MFTIIKESHRALARKHGTLLARLLMGALFLLAGLGKISTFAGVATYIGSVGLPMPEVLAALTIVLEVGGGLFLILGLRTSCTSAALALFTLVATGIFHHPGLWSDTVQQIMFMKNLAIIGGLIYMLGYGPGDSWSLDRTMSKA